jgi:RHS repeat-associated protein
VGAWKKKNPPRENLAENKPALPSGRHSSFLIFITLLYQHKTVIIFFLLLLQTQISSTMPLERKHTHSKANANFNYWLNDAINQDEYEEMIFFYHKDHLGSSTQISDPGANIIQHIEYLPYGETFFERRLDDYWTTPYKFNAKELDAETGLYYYGARYYTPEVSIWLSVDPLADKYPSMSPFMYCLGNPVKLIDPTGMSAVGPDEWEIVISDDGSAQMNHVSTEGGDKTQHVTVKRENRQGEQTEVVPSTSIDCTKDQLIEAYDKITNNSSNDNTGGIEKNNDNWAVNATGIYLTFFLSDLLTPEPTDIVVPKWAGHAVLITVSAGILIYNGESIMDQFAQHGKNRGKLSQEELEIIEKSLSEGSATNVQKQKYKRHQKNTGQRKSRQTKK